MAINVNDAPGGGLKAETLPIGNYPARLVGVVDLGVQPQSYKGEEKHPVRMIYVTYELTDEFMLNDDGEPNEEKPRWISEMFALHNIKADKAKSTLRYLALDPQMKAKGDFTKLLGTPCFVTVVHNEKEGKTYENVGGISAMRDKDAKRTAPLVNSTTVFDVDEPDIEVFNSLQEWLQEKIKKNLTYNGSALQKALGGVEIEAVGETSDRDEGYELDDEIPF